MEKQFENYAPYENAAADGQSVTADGVRITVLTPYLIRVEEQLSSVFCDLPTQAVICRSFDAPSYTVSRESDCVAIRTDAVTFRYSYRKKKVLSVMLSDGSTVTDFKTGNLKGTRRTLDQTYGEVKLEDGILSRNGVAMLDDSGSLIIGSDGRILPRKVKSTDRYYFCYGRRYIEAVRDYFRLTGMPPLIPRYALGNWWSRYKAYTAQEYMALMQRFIDEKIPITVATIDMDWHWVDVVDRFGPDSRDRQNAHSFSELFFSLSSPGWTGYSWNTDLFPDPKAFLAWLKSKNLKVTMNLHPASGCKFFEDAYPEFAGYMGIDPDSKQKIAFDITDEKFISGYFRYLHRPHEEMGVDFWWIDWQQGKKTRVPGLDPLWALNHYHFCDAAKNGVRPLILSRFAGVGSHRYPLGFSGDTAQTWAALDFQPNFTATASNIGYTWWSHDIGGHHAGIRDDEMYLRWVQFGVFSPIMRLHSTSNEFMGKEPWKYNTLIGRCAAEAMRFRHRLLPYLYTMNHRTAAEGRALIEPLYYLYPEDERAYRHPNEYFFGSELLVCPITAPVSKKTNLASVNVFLPEGRYTDIFSDRIYNGGMEIELFRDEASIPVLAREGAVIPMGCNDTDNDWRNPEELELLVFRGNSSFTLYEDDGETMRYRDGSYAQTPFTVTETENAVTFAVGPAVGDLSVLPEKRSFIVTFRDVTDAAEIAVVKNGRKMAVNRITDPYWLRVQLKNISPEDQVTIVLTDPCVRRSPAKRELKIELVSKIQGENIPKSLYTKCIEDDADTVPECMKKPFAEVNALF